MTEAISVAPDLFEDTVEGLCLIGGRRRADGCYVFPLPSGASAAPFERVRLGRTGTLWSWTVQRFRPKSPHYAGPSESKPFVPYAVGYVELPGQEIVESRLKVEDFSALRLGLPMEVVAETFAAGEDGNTVVTYAFRPVAETAR
jgi:uncharacterized OB-fold protein